MRAVLVAVVIAVLLALPAAAAEIDPKALVLDNRDVPAGFRLDRDESGIRSNAAEAKNDPRLPTLFRRWGRLTGYQVEYDRGKAKIQSRVDVCRRPAGARQLLDWYDGEVRKLGFGGLRRAPARIGNQGWVYRVELPTAATIVAWRHGRVFAGVMGQGVTRQRTIALARAQQRRIAAAG